ncbi:MAG: DinB family protein [Gemmatimonadales bacterium]
MITTAYPGADEYATAFAGYLAHIAEDEDILALLASQLDQVLARLGRISEARGDYRYAPEKWSIKELVGHLSDAERIFAYRALRVGRGDATPLPSFDEQAYAAEMRAGDRTLADLTAEWGDVRRASLALFRNLPAAAWQRRGIAGDRPMSVRAAAYIIAGHVRHHLETLETRYSA